MATSSPHRRTSKQAVSGPSGSKEITKGFRSQDELLSQMEAEIADQTFQFPASTLARMLSAKQPKAGVGAVGDPLMLDQYDCAVDTEPFQNALKDVSHKLAPRRIQTQGSGEVGFYPDLAKFLTTCIRECHKSLDKEEEAPQNRWYRDLQFVKAKQPVDRIEGAVLKPDLTGGVGVSAISEERLSWVLPEGEPDHQLTIPVEVKNNWRDMVLQASTYARALFSVDRPRSFALTLTFNQDTHGSRFLVLHRGGVTASELCNISEADGQKNILRLFLALTSWTDRWTQASSPSATRPATYFLQTETVSNIYQRMKKHHSQTLLTFVAEQRMSRFSASHQGLRRPTPYLIYQETLHPLRQQARVKICSVSSPIAQPLVVYTYLVISHTPYLLHRPFLPLLSSSMI